MQKYGLDRLYRDSIKQSLTNTRNWPETDVRQCGLIVFSGWFGIKTMAWLLLEMLARFGLDYQAGFNGIHTQAKESSPGFSAGKRFVCSFLVLDLRSAQQRRR